MVRPADRGLQGVPLPEPGAGHRRRAPEVIQGHLRARRAAQRVLALQLQARHLHDRGRVLARGRGGVHPALGPAHRDLGADRQGARVDARALGRGRAGARGLRDEGGGRDGEPCDPAGRGGGVSVARSGRFAGERAPAFVALNSSLALDWRLWREDIEGSVAHAHALEKAGVLSAAERRAVEEGLAALGREIEAGAFAPRDEDEDVHMAIERRLTELAGDAGARLHTGRSRNDQVVTDVRLHLRRVVERQDGVLGALQGVLLGRAADHVETLLPAYTHLQRAQVTSLAQHLLAYVWMLDRDRGRLAAARDACLELPLGAGAAVGLNYELDREAVAAELGFDRVAENSIDAVASRDFVLDYLAAAAQLGSHLSRLGAELVLWSSAEFGFVRLPDAFSGGSSIMPQKRNPDAAELMRAAAPRLAADLGGLLGVLHG
ncbi:MAG: argininosuccinate lyase, partial [Actinomycetota bacterium]